MSNDKESVMAVARNEKIPELPRNNTTLNLKARQKEAILRYLDSIETINNREARVLLKLQEKDRYAVSRLFAELVSANEIVQIEDGIPKNVKYKRLR